MGKVVVPIITAKDKTAAGDSFNGSFLANETIDKNTNIEVISLHLYTSGSVVVALKLMFLLCAMWRICQKKNRLKICHFICTRKCRYGEDMMNTPEPSMAFTTRGGPRVETIPVDSAGLVQLVNQLALNSAVAQMQSRSCRSLNINADNNTNVTAAETGASE